MSSPTLDFIVQVLIRESQIILAGHAVKITADRSLAELGFDSMSFVELLVGVERHFGVKLMEAGIRPEDLKNLETLGLRIHSMV